MYKIKSAIYCLTVAAMGLISANAQIIEPAASFQKLSAENYFRLHYDNDYFTGTDRYYTQGITLEYVHPSFQQFFLTKLLWHPYTSAVQTGICFNLFGFTPISTSSDEILYGDRPFDANMTISFFPSRYRKKNNSN